MKVRELLEREEYERDGPTDHAIAEMADRLKVDYGVVLRLWHENGGMDGGLKGLEELIKKSDYYPQ